MLVAIVCWVLTLTFDSLQPTPHWCTSQMSKRERRPDNKCLQVRHLSPCGASKNHSSDKIGPNGERVAGMTPPMPEWAPGRIQAQLKTHIQSSLCGAGSHTSKIKHFHEKIWLYTKTCLSLRIQNAVPGNKDKMILEE